MALEGTLRDFPLPDIIQLLGLSRKTGAVEITGSDGFGTGRLFFHQGRVVSAELGELPALEAVFAFFTFPGGDFRFDEHELPPPDANPLPMSNEILIMEGVGRADEWEKLRRQVPSMDLVLGLVADPVAGNRDINLNPDEWRVLTMVNGHDSVRDIALHTQFGDFKTVSIVNHLLTTGLIELLGVTSPARAAGLPAGPGGMPAAFMPTLPDAPASRPASSANGQASRPATGGNSVIRPLSAAVSAPAVPDAPPEAEPALPAASPPEAEPALPSAPAGPSLYARLESVAVSELGHSGRLMLSDAFKRLRLQPGLELNRANATSLCDQFERGATMLVGTSRARTLTDLLRQATTEFFGG